LDVRKTHLPVAENLVMSFDYILEIISTYSGLLPVAAFIYNFRQLDRLMNVIGVFFVIAALVDILLHQLTNWGVTNNIPLIHVFVIINIVFFCAIYYKAFFVGFAKKLTLILCGLALVITLFFLKNILEYPTQANTASSIAFIVLSLVYFYQLLNRQEFVHIEKQGLFWFNSAVLFYFSINIFLFMLIIRIPVNDRPVFYVINNITNIIANLLYTIALLCQPQRTT
jgi:hypothetical protein